jgi:hypothetical protein
VLAVALIALIVSNLRRPAATSPTTTRLSVALPETMAIARITSPSHTLAISPDGQRIVFMGTLGPGRLQLYLRALDALKVEPIPGTDGARQPFFSPRRRLGGLLHDRRRTEEGFRSTADRRSRSPAAC